MKTIITILAFLVCGFANAGTNYAPKFKIYKKPNVNCNSGGCDVYGYTFTLMSADERSLRVNQILVNGRCERLPMPINFDMGRSIEVWDNGSECGSVMKITIQTDKGNVTYTVR